MENMNSKRTSIKNFKESKSVGSVDLFTELYVLLRQVASLDPVERLQGTERIRELWRSEAIAVFAAAPDDLEEKLSEGDEAFQSFQRLMKMLSLPSSAVEPKAWSKKAEELLREKKFEKAFQAFKRAIAQEDVTDAETLTLAGTAALHCDRLDYAEEYADQALLIEPECLRATMLKALARYNQQDYPSALELFEKAQSISPESQTIVKYLEQTREQLKLESQNASFNTTSDPRAKRRWPRKPCRLELVINDPETMWPMSLPTKSLSAGGCLVELPKDGYRLADEFNFELELGSTHGRIHGTARKIYVNEGKEAGIRFCFLAPNQEDLINQRVISMA